MQVVISVKLFSQGGRITCAMLYEKTKKKNSHCIKRTEPEKEDYMSTGESNNQRGSERKEDEMAIQRSGDGTEIARGI